MFDNYSKEEQLLWERKKCASWGITSYDLDPVSGRIIFPAGGSLFFCSDPASGHTGPLFPYEIQVKLAILHPWPAPDRWCAVCRPRRLVLG